MPQTIIARFLGPTNHRGSRIKATAWRASVTVPYDYALSQSANHYAAAEALCLKLSAGEPGFWRTILGAETPDGTGFAFIIEHFHPAD
jgi:hypothetical protein